MARHATNHNLVTCRWLTPTRLMPHVFWLEADAKPWSCLRDGCPRPLTMPEIRECGNCPRWEAHNFDATKRDLVFETWGVGVPVPAHEPFDAVKRHLILEAWGV